MRLLFFGSPEAAVPFLEECGRPPHQVLSVVTRPDRPSGRGLAPKAPAVKAAALRLGLSVLQPEDPSSVAGVLKALGADMAVVVAYGKILEPELLGASRLGSLNVHFSLLPRCRGAAPVAWTLLRGEKLGGVSLFWLDAGMDTGPLQRAAPEEVRPEDDALTLMGRLVSKGVLELRAALRDIEAGRVRREPQKGEPTLAPKLKASDARLGFDRGARELHDRVRALRAGPRAYLELKVPGKDGKPRVTVLRTAMEIPENGPADAGQPVPGRIRRIVPSGGFLVECGSGLLWVLEVQPEGKKPVSGADFLNGLRIRPGERLEAFQR
mgnify:CR=1 FL=1